MNTNDATDLFLSLTPEKVLESVEEGGVRCNPVCYPLNSFENRVYEVELEDRTRLVAKFYRPGRWTEAQILEEHQFMADLEAAELPICGLQPFPGGGTLRRMERAGTSTPIFFCLYGRKGGRAPDEVDPALAERLGMFVARMHNEGVKVEARHRRRMTADAFIRDNVDWLVEQGRLPASIRGRYLDVAFDLADIVDERMEGKALHRIHGDFHLGNLLVRDGALMALDFDDMVVGPAVQDLWLALPASDAYGLRLREHFLAGYEQFRPFDRSELELIEPLRALRIIHYSTWLARRWHDPVFPAVWPHFGTEQYWLQETELLEDLLAGIRAASGLAPAAKTDEEPELTNKDFFWDWQG